MKIISPKILCLCLCVWLWNNTLYSQILAWDFNGNTGSETTVNATTVDPNLNVSTLYRSGGISATNLNNTFAATNFTTNGGFFNAFYNEYLEFQISATCGYTVSLSTLDVNFRRTNKAPSSFRWLYSLDGFNFYYIGVSDISYTVAGGNGTPQTQIDLSTISDLQNVPSNTTIYVSLIAWNATGSNGKFAIGRLSGNDLSVGGSVTATTTTWNGTTWDNGAPNSGSNVILNANYNTLIHGGSFNACKLTVNPTSRLTIEDNTSITVENDTNNNGDIVVMSKGAFIQKSASSRFYGSGTSSVAKTTPLKQNWFYYTYWSSPVVNETIGNAFFDVDTDRRFWFDASKYLDGDGDGIDDDRNDWQYALDTDVMTPGVGYAATSGRLGMYPSVRTVTFNGALNNGTINSPVHHNASNVNESWNLIGNPYPSAIDFDTFYAENADVIGGTVYFWSHHSPANGSNGGNNASNFSQSDYATYTIGTGGVAGASGTIPNKYIPSGQAFFIDGLANANVTFNNSMRVANTTGNAIFFKQATHNKSKGKQKSIQRSSNAPKDNSAEAQRLWINLTTDSGAFYQTLIGYVDGATNANDGSFFDAERINNTSSEASIYSTIPNDNKKYVVQGKASNALNTNEVIALGFENNKQTLDTYEISIAQLEGNFLRSNTVYLKDNTLGLTHNLSANTYIFTSLPGTFNNRFEIVFTENNTLSSSNIPATKANVSIIQTQNTFKIKTTNSSIKHVSIFDLQGKMIYKHSGSKSVEYLNIEHVQKAVYIARIELSNGGIATKRFIKK